MCFAGIHVDFCSLCTLFLSVVEFDMNHYLKNFLTAFLVLVSAIFYSCSDSGTSTGPSGSNNNTGSDDTADPTVVTTLAGYSPGTNGTGPRACFNSPSGIVMAGGNIYVADYYSHIIRKIDPVTQEVTILAGKTCVGGTTDGTGTAARLTSPYAITTDGTNLYVTNYRATYDYTIRKIVISTGEVSTLAGNFYNPRGITYCNGYLYMTDGYMIRKISVADGSNSDLAGSLTLSGYIDDNGTAARFTTLYGITNDGTSLYVYDNDNYRIRKIDIATADVTTFAGSGTQGSNDSTDPNLATFNGIFSLSTDGTSLYAADKLSSLVRKIEIATGAVSTIAGSAGNTGSADGTGTSARFCAPEGITTGDGSVLYVADTSNHIIRKVVTGTGAVTTLAGVAGKSGTADGTGKAARFFYCKGIASDGTNLYISDSSNFTIRKIVIATGEVTTFAGQAGTAISTDGTGSNARFGSPLALALNGTDLYVIDVQYLRKVNITSAEVTTVSGSELGEIHNMVYVSGYLYAPVYSMHTIIRIDPGDGTHQVIAGSENISGTDDGTGAAARFNSPAGIAYDGTSLYVADSNNHAIRKITMGTWEVTTVAGNKTGEGKTDGTGTSALFSQPNGITFKGSSFYIADMNNNLIRKMVIDESGSGVVTTLAGTTYGGVNTCNDGTGSEARFNYPHSIVKSGNCLYVTDYRNSSVRKISPE